MKAMVLAGIVDLRKNLQPLQLVELPIPEPGPSELLIRVSTCGVCHTELDEIEGRTPPEKFPMTLGHQVVGRVEKLGQICSRFQPGDRIGVGWIYSACGKCRHCLSGDDNLCKDYQATGRDAPGGYAEYMTIPENYAFAIPAVFTDEEAAPLLCAGAIGYRSLRLTGLKNGDNLGLTGFGASGHLVLKLTQHLFPQSKIFVFARSEKERKFAMELGAAWTGPATDPSPEKMAAIIDTTPVWTPVVEALKNLDSGGRLVINAIRKENHDKSVLMNLDYPSHLWMEREIKSVANVASRDIREFLQIAADIPIKPEVELFPLERANDALMELKTQRIRGAKVLGI